MTTHGLPSSSMTSKTVVTHGWSSRAATRASRIVRSRSTLRSSSLRFPPKVTSFSATSRPSTRSLASQTTPMPPRPRTPASS